MNVMSGNTVISLTTKMKPKEIAADIIAEGMLQPGTDEVSKVYSVLMKIDKYIVRYLEKESGKKRKKKSKPYEYRQSKI